jgi:hypothetical protein
VVGVLKDAYCYDFSMEFHLKLISAGGAAWALRVKDPENYYLFYLSGPEGEVKNSFIIYLVRDNEFIKKLDHAVPTELRAGGQYTIEISVEKNKFTHAIRDEDKDGERTNLGLWTDQDNTFPSGSVAFRTLHNEKFSIDDLYLRPPGIRLPE